jgi:glycerol-3-phosphate dehydrogenase (NAD(P)+)
VKEKKIAIIGAGSCGTSLAIALSLSPRPHRISLWVHGADVLDSLRKRRENSVYLPGFQIPEQIEVTSHMSYALADAGLILGAMPSAHARSIYSAMRPHIPAATAGNPGPVFVSATKGLERDTLARISQVIAESLPGEGAAPRIAVLSGPSFARELAHGDPTAVVIASEDSAAAAEVQDEFSGPTLRLYTNPDVIGVEICAAAKNVIAIAAGVCAGLGLGGNTSAALITRGLAEMTRLSVAAGGRRETASGLAGLGDLILTATGSLSRNRSVGVELGKGRPLAEILAGMRMVAEGVGTTSAMLALARRYGIETPIAEQVHAVLHEGRPARQAIRELMDRPLKQE